MGLGFGAETAHTKVISCARAPRQGRAPMAGLERATKGSLEISQWNLYRLCYQRHRCLQFSGPLSGHGAGGGALTRERKGSCGSQGGFTIYRVTNASFGLDCRESEFKIGCLYEASPQGDFRLSLSALHQAKHGASSLKRSEVTVPAAHWHEYVSPGSVQICRLRLAWSQQSEEVRGHCSCCTLAWVCFTWVSPNLPSEVSMGPAVCIGQRSLLLIHIGIGLFHQYEAFPAYDGLFCCCQPQQNDLFCPVSWC
ncbi:hypothetical protein PoB_004890900 [Plakobranchus ocellatus]|uniref:Uncharacterized protein n=1 Tax=Plakobranchus ocellatus TaxID=259542 RepID=A0AAV4BUE1_9GAST|nr:hypothetical protein PoB_004890900 [Plakobranchus ocellatus]